MKENKDRIINYFVTMSFVIFLFLFLFSLVFLSRLALSQDSELGGYFVSTQEILNEADRVQDEVENQDLENRNVSFKKNKSYFNLPNNVNLIDFSTLNTNKGESFVTFKFNKTTFVENGTLYYKAENIDDINKGDFVLDSKNNKNYVFDIEENSKIVFYVIKNETFFEGNLNDVKGVILYDD